MRGGSGSKDRTGNTQTVAATSEARPLTEVETGVAANMELDRNRLSYMADLIGELHAMVHDMKLDMLERMLELSLLETRRLIAAEQRRLLREQNVG